MYETILNVLCIVAPILGFVMVGRRLERRRRERLSRTAYQVSKKMPYKAQGILPKYPPAGPKSNFFQLDLVKEGVIAIHNSWRQKWHGSH